MTNQTVEDDPGFQFCDSSLLFLDGFKIGFVQKTYWETEQLSPKQSFLSSFLFLFLMSSLHSILDSVFIYSWPRFLFFLLKIY